MKFFAGFTTGFLVALLGVLFWLKKDVVPETTDPVTENVSLASNDLSDMPAGFEAFFNRFHQDSVFQMSRIDFPLEGIPSNADSLQLADNSFRWSAQNWVLHRPFNSHDGQFERKFVPLGDDLVVEQIKVTDGQFGMMRRFAREAEGWRLIYYAGMNRLAVDNPQGE